MTSIVLLGASGRMGRAIAQAAAEGEGTRVRACVDAPGAVPASASGWSTDLAAAVTAGDVVVEFSSPAGAATAARVCAERGLPLVSGSTGLGAAEEAAVGAAARRVAVVRAANFSLGIAALRRVLREAIGSVPTSWDIEIVERHHRRKADSPSGTALALARDALAARGWPEGALRFGREGRVGARPDAEIGVHAVRGGSWVGDHQVLLAGAGEWIELRHVALDRAAFAHGAIAAASFAASAAPGLYNIEDVLAAKR